MLAEEGLVIGPNEINILDEAVTACVNPPEIYIVEADESTIQLLIVYFEPPYVM